MIVDIFKQERKDTAEEFCQKQTGNRTSKNAENLHLIFIWLTTMQKSVSSTEKNS